MNTGETRMSDKFMLIAMGLCIFVLAPVTNVSAQGQLIENPGFEEPAVVGGEMDVVPDNWITFSLTEDIGIGISREFKRVGAQSVMFSSTNSVQGLVQLLNVDAGRNYEFVAHVFIDPEHGIGMAGRGQLSIEWKNERDEEVARSWGPDWGHLLPAGVWHAFSMTATAPEDATSAAFVITQFGSQDAADLGIFYVDEAAVWDLP